MNEQTCSLKLLGPTRTGRRDRGYRVQTQDGTPIRHILYKSDVEIYIVYERQYVKAVI